MGRARWACRGTWAWTGSPSGCCSSPPCIFLLAIVAACWRPPERPRAFLALLLLAETGLLGLFAAGHLVLFYVFWEAMLVPFYFLIGMWGGEGRGARDPAVRHLHDGRQPADAGGDPGHGVHRPATSPASSPSSIRDLVGVQFTETQSTWLFLGFALAFAIKLPLWPFHGWLPGAYRTAPILVTGLLAAVMSKAGVYGLLRIGLPVFPEGADRLAIPIGVLAVIGIVYGSLMAWRAPTMRMLVAYSSLAHLGFIVLGVVALRHPGVPGRRAADGQPRRRGGRRLRHRRDHQPRARRTTASTTSAASPRGAPRLAGVFLIVAMASLAIPGSNSSWASSSSSPASSASTCGWRCSPASASPTRPSTCCGCTRAR